MEPLIIKGECPDSIIRSQIEFDLQRIVTKNRTDEETEESLRKTFGQYPEKLAKIISFPILINSCNPEVSEILIENIEKHFEIMEDEIRAIIYAAGCSRECEKK